MATPWPPLLPVRALGSLAVLQALALPWAKEKVTESLKGPRGSESGGESLAQVLCGAWKSGDPLWAAGCASPFGQRPSRRGQGIEGGVRAWVAGSL